jgi:hypothetical protein
MTRLLSKIAFVSLLGALWAIPAHAASDQIARVAAGPACPAAPSGWTAAPENPTIWGPIQDPGQNSEKVTCTYSNGTKIAQVASIFALPSDPNPYSDFNYGCTAPVDRAWDPTNRIYIIGSKTVWAYAELDDSENQLAAGDVGGFESATRSLLKLSEPLAHSCKITTTETSVSSSFGFSFEYAELGKNTTIFGGVSSTIPGNPEVPAGSFTTKTSSKGSSSLEKITSVHVPLIPMTVVQSGKKHTVVLKITKGSTLYIKTPVQTMRAELEVVRSDDPSCKRGSRGTFLLSTVQEFANKAGAHIKIALCGALFSTGKQVAQGSIING